MLINFVLYNTMSPNCLHRCVDLNVFVIIIEQILKSIMSNTPTIRYKTTFTASREKLTAKNPQIFIFFYFTDNIIIDERVHYFF